MRALTYRRRAALGLLALVGAGICALAGAKLSGHGEADTTVKQQRSAQEVFFDEQYIAYEDSTAPTDHDLYWLGPEVADAIAYVTRTPELPEDVVTPRPAEQAVIYAPRGHPEQARILVRTLAVSSSPGELDPASSALARAAGANWKTLSRGRVAVIDDGWRGLLISGDERTVIEVTVMSDPASGTEPPMHALLERLSPVRPVR